MLEILTKITEGKGTLEDIDDMQDLAHNIKKGALCGLGQTAPNPVLSTLKYFRHEYEAHVVDKKCPAGVCKNLMKYVIQDDICKRCGICKKNCPGGCIDGNKNDGYKIDKNQCLKCGVCMSKCPFKAIVKE